MEKPLLVIVLIIVVLLIVIVGLTGCSTPYLRIAGANSSVRRGLYQKALASYLNTSAGTGFESVVSYNVGNVYYYLGEEEKALSQWNLSTHSEFKEVSYRSYFNNGVVLYGANEFDRAAESFLSALKVFPDRLHAKINLEYCIRQLDVVEQKRSVSDSPPASSMTDSVEVEMLINILNQSETYTWERDPFSEETEDRLRDW